MNRVELKSQELEKTIARSVREFRYSKNWSLDKLANVTGLSKSYCVGMVDMVNSTKISAGMNELEWCKYYEIFL